MKTFREILEGKGLIINSLSMASRISEDTIRGICSGRVNLGKCYRDTLAKLAEALDMQPEELAEVGNDGRNDVPGNGVSAEHRKSHYGSVGGRKEKCPALGLFMGRTLWGSQRQPVGRNHHDRTGRLPQKKIPVRQCRAGRNAGY